MWFAKKITIYKKKSDKETWTKIKDLLKEAGFKGVRASHYPIESLNACGCGAKVDPRNFGANGHIDRDIYFVDVREEDSLRAKDLLSQHEINLVVESDPWGKFGRM
ncbi:MAG: hypothetical protein IJQ56_11055 [Synergistaceae bacterium]|nr:hypothetical protein [Synergistaceae bacterium]